jgi:hypothetical protein
MFIQLITVNQERRKSIAWAREKGEKLPAPKKQKKCFHKPLQKILLKIHHNKKKLHFTFVTISMVFILSAVEQ